MRLQAGHTAGSKLGAYEESDMNTLLMVFPAAALVLAIAAAIQLAVLAFRNPFRPAWLRQNWAAIAAALLVTAATTAALGVMITAASRAGLGILPAIGVTLLIAVGGGYAIARLFDVGERLRRADAGQSPFAPVGNASGLPRSWRLGGGTDA